MVQRQVKHPESYQNFGTNELIKPSVIYCIFGFYKSLGSNFKKTINWGKNSSNERRKMSSSYHTCAVLLRIWNLLFFLPFSSHSLDPFPQQVFTAWTRWEFSKLKWEWKSEIHAKAARMKILSWIYYLLHNCNCPFTWTFEQAIIQISDFSLPAGGEAPVLLLGRNSLPKLFKFKLGKELILLQLCCLHNHSEFLRFEFVRN